MLLSVAAFSSSDEDEEYSKVELVALRRKLRQESDVFSLPNHKLNKDAFKYVLHKCNPHLSQARKSSSVPNILKIAATMRILAEGSYQKGAGNDFNINLSQSSMSKVFNECINVMYNELCPRWISFVMDENEKKEVKDYFYKKTGFPGVIGCVDGTHVKILAPLIEERFKYYNRKGFYSLNTMLVCDHKLRIRYISSHNPGSSHDSLIWNASDLKQLLKDAYDSGEKNIWLLGDAGYPLEPFLITPFRSTVEGSTESRFNFIHSKTRNVVERCIGVLKNRFRCILGARQLHYKPHFAGKITAVCAALHNICIDYKIEFTEDGFENEVLESPIDEPNSNLTASCIRQKIMESIIN